MAMTTIDIAIDCMCVGAEGGSTSYKEIDG